MHIRFGRYIFHLSYIQVRKRKERHQKMGAETPARCFNLENTDLLRIKSIFDKSADNLIFLCNTVQFGSVNLLS
ncbi:hypothetical protein MKHDV_01370 [Halodesulfovibrio sp. MK-HDV]|jgi:hypothetical protein|nr:hypothetical protein MKHDV_01370 [Halodesulfovibrio sp. MK-HDV]